jgi:hypothetical protein
MRIAEVIRNILDVLDAIDQYDQEQQAAKSAATFPQDNEAAIRTKQIQDLLDKQTSGIANSPNEQYADIDAITASGTDVNKSKNPADIRTNAPSMYPTKQWGVE